MTLRTIEPYTTDSRKLSAAVETLATTATSALTREPSPLDHMIGRAQTSPTASAADGGYGLAGFPQSPGGDSSETGAAVPSGGWPGLIAMLKRMERTYMQFLYESQGRASMIGLQALVDSLGDLPGRKTVLYFCEGLTITEQPGVAVQGDHRHRQPEQRQRLHVRLRRSARALQPAADRARDP